MGPFDLPLTLGGLNAAVRIGSYGTDAGKGNGCPKSRDPVEDPPGNILHHNALEGIDTLSLRRPQYPRGLLHFVEQSAIFKMLRIPTVLLVFAAGVAARP